MSINTKKTISKIVNSQDFNYYTKKTLIDSFLFLSNDINENSEESINEIMIQISRDIRDLNSYIKSKKLN